MLRIYRHRVNSLRDVASLPAGLGVELDLRSDGGRVIVTHDPFTDGPTIAEYFPLLRGRPCILNIKCEGIESRVLEEAARHDLRDLFLLDCSVPAINTLLRAGERRMAVRYSEIEPIEALAVWRGRVDWVWVDCFTHFPGSPADWTSLRSHFRLCVVSPELQGHGEAAQQELRMSIAGHPCDAVCTKRPELWRAEA